MPSVTYEKFLDSIPDEDTIPWDEAPEGATHALWGTTHQEWYFWLVDMEAGPDGDEIVTHYWRFGYGHWQEHRNQDQSHPKLANAIERPTTGSKPRRNTGMNLRNAALLVRDDIQTVQVSFLNNGMAEHKTYTYLLPEHVSAEVGETVLVKPNGNFKTAVVVEIDDEPNIDPNSDIRYCWVFANVDELVAKVNVTAELTDLIEDKLKKQQATNVREQILRQFGVSSVAGLLGEAPQSTEGVA